MSGSEKAIPKDEPPKAGGQTSAPEDKLRDEAFERAKKDLSSSFSGGANRPPDIFSKVNSGTFPTVPFDNLPAPPVIPSLDKSDPSKLLRTETNLETTATKLAREALVIGGGVGESFFYGVANLPDHLPQIATSMAIGGILSALTKTGKLGAYTSMVAGAYFTSRFVLDSIHDHKRWSKFGDAVKDTWHSDEHTLRNMHTVRNTLGNYVFDTSLSMASGYVGYKNPQISELLLAILRVPPIVPNTPPIFSPALATTTMYMSCAPWHGLYNKYEDMKPWQPNSWSVDIHGNISRPGEGGGRGGGSGFGFGPRIPPSHRSEDMEYFDKLLEGKKPWDNDDNDRDYDRIPRRHDDKDQDKDRTPRRHDDKDQDNDKDRPPDKNGKYLKVWIKVPD